MPYVSPPNSSPHGGRSPAEAASHPLATNLMLPDTQGFPDPDFVVAVIDTGVSVSDGKPHPYIARSLAPNWIENTEPPPLDGQKLDRFQGHGTFVAGLIHKEAPTATIHMRKAPSRPNNEEQVAHIIEEIKMWNT
jgi:Subtilase family